MVVISAVRPFSNGRFRHELEVAIVAKKKKSHLTAVRSVAVMLTNVCAAHGPIPKSTIRGSRVDTLKVFCAVVIKPGESLMACRGEDNDRQRVVEVEDLLCKSAHVVAFGFWFCN